MRGLFRGATAGIPRTIVGSMSQLTTFSYSKDLLTKKEIFVGSPLLMSFVASMIGGFITCLMMTPFDLVSTRIYNQGTVYNDFIRICGEPSELLF